MPIAGQLHSHRGLQRHIEAQQGCIGIRRILRRPCFGHRGAHAYFQRNQGPAKWSCTAAKDDEQPPSLGDTSSLTATLRRKREQLAGMLSEYSEEDLYNRLGGSDFGRPSAGSMHRFAGLIPEVRFREGRPVLALEVGRLSPSTPPAELAELAKQYEAAGADALVVPTDAFDTPTGLADLLSVCRAVKIPVVRRDWVLHPLQILEAKEAGACGVMGIVTSVLGNNAAVLSSYAASLGMDCPVEVVNSTEVQAMERLGTPFFGCNLAVGLSLAIPGFRSDMARGLLGKLPFGSSSVVGARSMEEAIKAKEAGADMVFVKKEWLAEALKANGTCGNSSIQQPVSDLGGQDGHEDAQREGISSEWQTDEALISGHPENLQKKLSTERPKLLQSLVVNFMRELKYATSGDD